MPEFFDMKKKPGSKANKPIPHDNHAAALALHGGKPVRTRPMPRHCIGANLIGREEMALLRRVIDSQCLFRHSPGSQHMVEAFEKELRDFLGVRFALATSSGSGALTCAMMALGVGRGDEVVIPAFGWVSDYSVVALAGATPVIAEIDDSLNLNPESFEACITRRTKTVIVVHYQGAASRLDEIVAIARRNQIAVIEDVAQAIGGTFGGRKLGTWGDAAIFSLQHNKVICSGEGGAFVTKRQEIYERAVRAHDLGMLRPVFKSLLPKPVISQAFPGFQWRMNELAGAVALAQLRKLPAILEAVNLRCGELRATLAAAFPSMKYRAVRPENDMGIVIELDLGSAENVRRFREAYEAEGLIFGATSGCGTLTKFEPVVATIGKRSEKVNRAFEKSSAIEGKMAGIAILPVHSRKDIRDIAAGVVKVIRGLGLMHCKEAKVF